MEVAAFCLLAAFGCGVMSLMTGLTYGDSTNHSIGWAAWGAVFVGMALGAALMTGHEWASRFRSKE